MITIETILNILKQDGNFREICLNDDYYYDWKNKTFDNLSYDSRQVNSETLFFIKGRNFKSDFLKQAVTDGLSFYISQEDYHVGIPVIMVNDIKQAMSLIAMHFYDYPQHQLQIIGLTGTKGKTTAAYFAYNILKQQFKPALLSTMNTTLDGIHFFKSSLTTPESLDLFKMMAEAVKNNMTHLIMEVSSQAYLVERVYGLTFDVGVFLNISPDHIGPIEHPTFEDYFYHKRQLLHNSKRVVINSDMNYFNLIKEEVKTIPHDYYGSHSEHKISNSSAFKFDVSGKLSGKYDIQLIGTFNQENATAAGLACLHLGATLEDIKIGIATTTVPGRMEVLTQSNGAKIFIDYAHNGDSVHKLIDVVRKHQSGKIILIIGATGNKGESRRKDFAQVINHYPELDVILTADDPNYENPQDIAEEINSYLNHKALIITDREQAIKEALLLTKNKDDAVIIAGKGADAFQIINGQRQPYPGDQAIAKCYL